MDNKYYLSALAVICILLGGCGKATADDPSTEYKLDCSVLEDSMNRDMRRCENAEAVCYLIASTTISMSCFKK